MDPPLAEENFCDHSNHPVEPHIVERYNRHKGYVDNADRMANSYSMIRRTIKWTTNLFFHLLDLRVPKSWILLSSCGAKYTHWYFRHLLARNLIEEAGRAKIAPPPDWLEDQVRAEKIFCDLRIAITNTVLRNLLTSCAAVCVLLAARERAQLISAPDVMLACVWCLVSRNITPKWICKLWILCVVIKQWSKVPQTFCSNQNYVSNKLFTLHFI
jgi:hypothetical protein